MPEAFKILIAMLAVPAAAFVFFYLMAKCTEPKTRFWRVMSVILGVLFFGGLILQALLDIWR